MFVKKLKYIGFCVYRRSYLIWSPVMVVFLGAASAGIEVWNFSSEGGARIFFVPRCNTYIALSLHLSDDWGRFRFVFCDGFMAVVPRPFRFDFGSISSRFRDSFVTGQG